ncbi:MAG: division/cell wall cluster transcriptional repressor MraZ [Propionibacteriaceae bacterium]|nr:division/cell wall cluster transcriptional repressor MraZ [Propionibacteriaceae bacterium]
MFVSTYPLKLDEKNRFFVPPKFRSQLADGLVIVHGLDHCLAAYPTADFEAALREAQQHPFDLRNVRGHIRMMAADAYETQADKQGRVSLPAALRNYAKLDKDIVVTGVGDHVEIWNPDAWAAYRAAEEERYSEIDGLVLQPRENTA